MTQSIPPVIPCTRGAPGSVLHLATDRDDPVQSTSIRKEVLNDGTLVVRSVADSTQAINIAPPPEHNPFTNPSAPPARLESSETLRRRASIARRLVIVAGSANESDAGLVVTELTRFSLLTLEGMEKAGVKVVVCRNSITDYRTDLEGVRPNGWPPGSTWDSVPGCRTGKEIIIATRIENGRRVIPTSGNGHGSFNLFMHEAGHALDEYVLQALATNASGDVVIDGRTIPPESSRDRGKNISRRDPMFIAAWEADMTRLPDYFNRTNRWGDLEAFTESLARYAGNDPTLKNDWPNLYKYWQNSPFLLEPRAEAKAPGWS